jgi:predicted nucleic acid-binding Zn ribbon protein
MPEDDDLAARMVVRARAASRSTSSKSGSSTSGSSTSGLSAGKKKRRRTEPTYGSAGMDDPRDPRTAGAVLDDWLRDAGFHEAAAAGGVEAQWETIAGSDVAAHVSAEVMDTESGRTLWLRADSTAWATQVKLLLPEIRRRIDEVVGAGIVADIRVTGPTPPKRAPGLRRVPGPGPRDTYG